MWQHEKRFLQSVFIALRLLKSVCSILVVAFDMIPPNQRDTGSQRTTCWAISLFICGFQITWEALHAPLVNQLGDTLSSGKLNLPPIQPAGARPGRGARLLLLIPSLALPTVSVGRNHPDRCGWTTWSWRNSPRWRKGSRKGKREKWTKRSDQCGCLPSSAYTCVHKGLYKGGCAAYAKV